MLRFPHASCSSSTQRKHTFHLSLAKLHARRHDRDNLAAPAPHTPCNVTEASLMAPIIPLTSDKLRLHTRDMILTN